VQVVIDNQALPRILDLLTAEQAKKIIMKEACWTISNITAGTKEQVQVEITLDSYCYCYQCHILHVT
jgi:importin subunit alpha-1